MESWKLLRVKTREGTAGGIEKDPWRFGQNGWKLEKSGRNWGTILQRELILEEGSG